MTLPTTWTDGVSTVDDDAMNLISSVVNGKADTAHTHTAANVSDATTVGKAVITAVDATAARTAIGAGTASTKTDVGLSAVTNNAQYFAGGADVAITDGGTGVSTLPTGLLKGAGTGAITAGTVNTDFFGPAGGIPAANLPNGLTNGNTSRQSQVVVSGTSYYIAGSNLNLPATLKAGMAVGTRFRWMVAMDKTAAGTGAFAIEIRRGTAGTTADTADVSQSVGTQTAVVDNMIVDVEVVVTTTGATGAYFWSIVPNNKAVTATGFGVATGTGAYFSGTVSSVALNTASLIFGLSFKATTGTPTITVPLVQASAVNID